MNALHAHEAALQIAHDRGDERAIASLQTRLDVMQAEQLLEELRRVPPCRRRQAIELLARQSSFCGDVARIVLAKQRLAAWPTDRACARG